MGLWRVRLGQCLCLGMIAIFGSLISACTTGKRIKKSAPAFLEEQIVKSEVFTKGFTGFALMDAESGRYLYQSNADKYFTPASNVKILTLYTCLHLLGDSIPALRYETRGDSLLFWGTGDPSLLNPQLENNAAVIDFLASRPERLFFCPYNFQDAPLGAGWSWDDYHYYFQPEKSALPIYGNLVTFEKEANTLQYEVFPKPFANAMVDRPDWRDSKAKVKRQLGDNVFEYNITSSIPHAYQNHTPFRYSDRLLTLLLGDTLRKEVAIYPEPIMPSAKSTTLYSRDIAEAYRQMMQESDNFISEQLLLLGANEVFDTLQTAKIIAYAKEQFLADLEDPVRWVDGSGLSRYNLLTPRSLSEILRRLYLVAGWDYLQKVFPAGGQSGTIKDWYGGGAQAYVFAKTGTLGGVHCLSGYLVAQSGRRLIFSFMHNNYTTGSRAYKEEMEKVLRNLYLAY